MAIGMAVRLAVALRGGAVEDLPVGRQGEERPGVPVHVVLEVKHLRETSPGRFVLGPRTIRVLRAVEIFDAAVDALAVRVVEGAEAHDGPGGLRGGAGALAL